MIEINARLRPAREDTYETARRIAHDYQLFGTGPGSFNPLFQLYRSSPEEYWPAQLHNDWLEDPYHRKGWLNGSLIALGFLTAIARWSRPGGIHGGRRFVVMLWLALRWLLPFALVRFSLPDLFSIVLLVAAICAVLFTLSRRSLRHKKTALPLDGDLRICWQIALLDFFITGKNGAYTPPSPERGL